MGDKFTHGGNIYKDGKQWLDFSANINPLGLAPAVRQAITNHIEDVIHYPEPNGTALKQALARHYGVPQDALLLGNGAAELFYTYFHALPGRRAVIPIPTFSEYERAALAGQATIHYVQTVAANGFSVPWTALKAAITAGATVVLGNPNNPTGRLLLRDELVPFLEYARTQGAQVLIDESFLDFRDDAAQYTALPLLKKFDTLLIYRSLTKFFALPGLRLGFACMAPALRQRLEGHKDVWNVNVLAQYAGVAALGERAYQRASRAYAARERDFLYTALQTLPDVTVYAPSVNFILLRLASTWGTAAVVQQKLEAAQILIRNCQDYPGLTPQDIRVAVRTRHENELLLRALRAVAPQK